MDAKKIEILEKATRVFLKYGIKSVTMDDMSRQLGISKKTLYAHFKDKNDLVLQIISVKTAYDRTHCEEVRQKAPNAIVELLQLSLYLVDMMTHIHPGVFFDLRKFHPDAWQLLHDHKWKFVKNTVLENIRRGKAEGLYREELIDEVAAAMYVSATDLISDHNVFSEGSIKADEAFREIIDFQLQGMTNSKGRNYLKNMNE